MEIKTRFFTLGAQTMIDLLVKMIQHAHPFARCIYFGKNEGDYSQYDDQELVKATQFIAVFDFAPVHVFEVDNVQVIQKTDNSDGSDIVTPKDKLTMSA